MHILTMITVFNAEETSSAYTASTVQQWDSDSGMIGIDNRCLASIFHDPADVLGDVQEFRRNNKDFGGKTHYNVSIGTIKWY